MIRLVAVASVLILAGCYTLRPVGSALPDPGTEVAFDITDAGRVALGGSMGPEIAQVQGRLLGRDGGEYLVAVSSVRLLRGGQQVWRGEQVRIRPEYVGSTYERRLSPTRSVALGAVAVGGLVAFFISRDLFGLGSGDPGKQPTDTAQTRIGRP